MNQSSPVQVSGMASGITAVTVGSSRSCAITSAGGAKCWGQNIYGGVGNGDSIDQTSPVNVSGLSSGVLAMDGGAYHTCALLSGGVVKCWGWNAGGNLGDGTYTNRSTPVSVINLPSGVVAISVGSTHSCALTSAGAVWCWGGNYNGQVGDGTYTDRTSPTQVSGLTSGVVQISVGAEHSCALTSDGGVKCWGIGTHGELGNNSNTKQNTPVAVSGLTSGVTSIGLGNYHTCAVLSSGEAKCWGYNGSSRLGDGTTTNRNTPVTVSGLTSGVLGIAGGDSHTCAITTSATVKCWGNNDLGQLGDGTTTTRSTPVTVSVF